MGTKYEKFGATVETRDDGTATVHTAAGGVLNVGKDGHAKLDLQTIASVGIHNVFDVESHQIARIAGSTSHFIRFHGGGEVRFAYNDKGDLLELSAVNCGLSLTNKNELLFQKMEKKD